MADVRITALPSATSVAQDDLFVIVDQAPVCQTANVTLSSLEKSLLISSSLLNLSSSVVSLSGSLSSRVNGVEVVVPGLMTTSSFNSWNSSVFGAYTASNAAALSAISSDIVSIKASATQSQADIVGLSTSVNALNVFSQSALGNITTLQADSTASKASISAINGKTGSYDVDILSLKADATASNAAFNSYTASSAAQIASLQASQSAAAGSTVSTSSFNDTSASVNAINSWTGSNSAIFAGTASYALTASYISSSFLNSSGPVTTITNTSISLAGNTQVTGALDVSGKSLLNGGLGVTGSTSLNGPTSVTGSFGVNGNAVINGSTVLNGNTQVTGALDVTGKSTLKGGLDVTGSTKLNGNTEITGALNVNGAVTAPSFIGSFTGSLQGTASWANNSVNALTASYIDPSSLTNIFSSNGITGSLQGQVNGGLTGSVIGNVTGNVTGNVNGQLTGSVLGNVTGNVNGQVVGGLTGSVLGNVTGQVVGGLTGSVLGNVNGQVIGGLTGSVNGQVTGSLLGNVTGQVTGGVTGSLLGTASWSNNSQTASYVDIQAGAGIEISRAGSVPYITASLRTVNGISPTNGNVSVSLTGTQTGTSASLVASPAPPTGSVWIISNDPNTALNGKTYLYTATGWSELLSFDYATADARFLKLDGSNSPMNGILDMGGNKISNIGVGSLSSDVSTYGQLTEAVAALTSTSSFNNWTGSTASNFAGTSSYSTTANQAATASYINPSSLTNIFSSNGITGSLKGNVDGQVVGGLTGSVLGQVNGGLTGSVLGNVNGQVNGGLTGSVLGNVTGNVNGQLTGSVLGNVTGNVTGQVTGGVTGSLLGTASFATYAANAGNASTASYVVSQVTISTSANITTDTLSDDSLSQNGRVVILNHSAPINVSLEASSAPNFCSAYMKHGATNVTFVAGAGITLVQVDSTAVMSGAVGSTATLNRVGTTYYLRINNA